jgi:hypothetical protein
MIVSSICMHQVASPDCCRCTPSHHQTCLPAISIPRLVSCMSTTIVLPSSSHPATLTRESPLHNARSHFLLSRLHASQVFTSNLVPPSRSGEHPPVILVATCRPQRQQIMRDILALPATLLALIAASTATAQHQQPRAADFAPEHQTHLKRERQAQEQLRWQQPVGMRKMSGDEGEKFFLHYWNFGDSPAGSETLEEYIEEAEKYANASIQLSAPIAPHFERAHTFRRFPGHSLFARDWGSCPTGTKSCTEIDRPDSCCSESDECIRVDDTGNGDVGCCPQGGNCGSSISDCDANVGQTSCPESENKGCCIQGYACYDVGCVWVSTVTTTTNLPAATATSGRTTNEPSTTTREETNTVVVAGGAGGSTYTTTIESTVTETAPGVTSIGTITAATTVTVTESAPETTEESTESEEPTTTSEQTEALPPARPTGSSEESPPESMTTTTSEPAPSDDSCPTGFYMCSAHYLGGCCRVGRNCDTTYCPTSDSTALVSNGVTIAGVGGNVAASTSTTTLDADGSSTTAASAQNGDTCANGWFMCGQNEGGGCCPSNYVCGASCTATVSGVEDQPKAQPSGAGAVRWAWGFFAVALGTGVGMVWL